MTGRHLLFWVLFAVTLGVYAVMVAWSLPKIAEAAGGLTPFDMRPMGYGFDEARAFFAALPPEAAEFYIAVQQRLDTAYPALLAATLYFAIRALAPPRLPVPSWTVALLAVPGMIFDYLENIAVAEMLRLGADGVTEDLVARASLWTLLKSAFTTLAMVVLLAFALMWLWWRFSGGGRMRAAP